MSRSVLYMSMSVDGYIAAPNDGPGATFSFSIPRRAEEATTRKG